MKNIANKIFILVLSACAATLVPALGPSAGAQVPPPGMVGNIGSVKEMEGAFLRQLLPRDSVLIADPLRYGFRLDGVTEGTVLLFPDFSKGFRDSIDLVSAWTVDTLAVKYPSGKKGAPVYDLEAGITITAFDEGEYLLPPLAVRRVEAGIADTLVFEPLVMTVCTMPVDTATFVLHDIKGQVRYPLTFKEFMKYAGIVLLCAALVFLLVWLIRRRKAAREASAPDEPAYLTALRKLDKLKGDKYWAPDRQKAFYSGVTDALREYIVPRFGVDATQMTTAEIMEALKDKSITPELYGSLGELFERADFVKFAKYVAQEDENRATLPAAVRFVMGTWEEPADAPAGTPAAPGEAPGTEPAAAPAAESGENGKPDGEEVNDVL